ncbi:hypothetical protein CR513_23889, partial [Mucuna pruriens]
MGPPPEGKVPYLEEVQTSPVKRWTFPSAEKDQRQCLCPGNEILVWPLDAFEVFGRCDPLDDDIFGRPRVLIGRIALNDSLQKLHNHGIMDDVDSHGDTVWFYIGDATVVIIADEVGGSDAEAELVMMAWADLAFFLDLERQP